jgi:hypothetical protein
MALSWNEIKDRALHFSKEWADTSNEEADPRWRGFVIRANKFTTKDENSK